MREAIYKCRHWVILILCVAAILAFSGASVEDAPLFRGRVTRVARLANGGDALFVCPAEWQFSTVHSADLDFADASRATHHADLWSVVAVEPVPRAHAGYRSPDISPQPLVAVAPSPTATKPPPYLAVSSEV